MTRELTDIVMEMAELASRRFGDAETLHHRADDLLIETIRWLASRTERSTVIAPCEEIISDWERTPRWYA